MELSVQFLSNVSWQRSVANNASTNSKFLRRNTTTLREKYSWLLLLLNVWKCLSVCVNVCIWVCACVCLPACLFIVVIKVCWFEKWYAYDDDDDKLLLMKFVLFSFVLRQISKTFLIFRQFVQGNVEREILLNCDK